MAMINPELFWDVEKLFANSFPSFGQILPNILPRILYVEA